MGRKKKQVEEPQEGVVEVVEESSFDETPVLPNQVDLKEVDKTLAAIEKEFGEGSVASASQLLSVNKIPTKNLLLDILTIGGLPQGSISLFYGPFSSGKTVQALLLASIFTSQKIPVMYILTEGDIDIEWVKKLGNDLDYFFVMRPDDLEKTSDIAHVAVASKKFGLVIIDSLTAGIPRDVLDKKTMKDHMALQARRNGKLVQKVTSALQPENLKNPDSYNQTMVILIAHLRMKVGLVFGCLHGDTKILFTDGTSHSIRDVVKKKLTGPVYCYDEKNKVITSSHITEWYINGKADSFITILANPKDSLNGKSAITVTPNHRVYTDSGWKEARDITTEDKLLSKYTKTINGTLRSFLLGVFVGDSCLTYGSTENTAKILLQDKLNPDYLDWKVKKLSALEFSPIGKTGRYGSKPSYELSLYKHRYAGRTLGEDWLHFTPLSLAVWYMDDGHSDFDNSHCRGSICFKRLRDNLKEQKNIAKMFKRFGLKPQIRDGVIAIFNKEEFLKLCDLIAPFIPECMQYKLPEEYRGRYTDFELINEVEQGSVFIDIESITKDSPRKMRNKMKYDITVQGYENYVAGGEFNGMVVHNSPKTLTGGLAIQNHAAYILEFCKGQKLSKDDLIIGREQKIVVEKSKFSPPLVSGVTEFFFYPPRYNNAKVLLTYAIQYGVIEKAGPYYSYKEIKAQGKQKLMEELQKAGLLPELKTIVTEAFLNR